MTSDEWLEAVRRHLAVSSVGSSTLRMQSGEGCVDRARSFLRRRVPVDGLRDLGADEFAKFLDSKTVALARELPRLQDKKPNWGAARKVLNIFLRSCAMNRDLHHAYRLAHVEPLLEVPLDGQIVAAIDAAGGYCFAANFRIRGLDRRASLEIQDAAMELAKNKGLFRYQLDVLYWNAE